MAQKRNRKKIGLVLGSGGSKGLAHIGVIKELERQGIEIDMIVGASIGALVGGFYAAKMDIREIETLAISTNWRQVIPMFFDPAIKQGLIRGDKFRKFINTYIGPATFNTTKIPFGAVVTDLTNAKAICLSTGDLPTAIRASISIPLLLKPVVIDKKVYVDGGLSMPVPVEFAKAMGAEIVIAVNLHEHYEGIMVDQKFGINTITYKSTDVLSHYLALENVRQADIVVSPNVATATLFNKFMSDEGTREVIREGELAMRAKLPELVTLLEESEPEIISVPKSTRFGLGSLVKSLRIRSRRLFFRQ